MDREKLHQFLTLKDAGQKQEAATAVQEFIDSFEPTDDRAAWVREFLESGAFGHRIRHEIYESLVFPVLHEGYLRGEFWSIFWLAKTIRNLHAAPQLHQKVQGKGEHQFLMEAFAIDPKSEVRAELVRANVRWFEYSQHEWPSGILLGTDGASLEGCEEILREVALTRTLDETGASEEFLNQFEQKVREYQEQLRLADAQSLLSSRKVSAATRT